MKKIKDIPIAIGSIKTKEFSIPRPEFRVT
jgi:hypothetical protein